MCDLVNAGFFFTFLCSRIFSGRWVYLIFDMPFFGEQTVLIFFFGYGRVHECFWYMYACSIFFLKLPHPPSKVEWPTTTCLFHFNPWSVFHFNPWSALFRPGITIVTGKLRWPCLIRVASHYTAVNPMYYENRYKSQRYNPSMSKCYYLLNFCTWA